MIKTICLDFDGVLHSYDSGWCGFSCIPDAPVPGAIDFLLDLLADDWEIAIHSSRSRRWSGRRAMKRWLRHHAYEHYGQAYFDAVHETDYMGRWRRARFLPDDAAPPKVVARDAARWLVRRIRWDRAKPPAIVTLDDRAIQFDGRFPDLSTLNRFKP